MTPFTDPDKPAEDAAADWLARHLAGPLDLSEQRAFMAWLNRSPAHPAAWRQAEAAWRQLEAVGRDPGPLQQDIAHLHGRPARRGLWRPLAAMAACLAVAAIGATLWLGNPVMLMRADYAAAPAQLRNVRLPDGSTVELAPGAALALDFSAAERRVELLAGSAYFMVTPQAAAGNRPFVVGSRNGSTRALGTQFAVDLLPAGGVRVAVTEHAVEVVAAGRVGPGDAANRLVVPAGRAVSYDGSGRIMPLDGADVVQATAWHRGKLIFDQQPVADVIAELNRYRRGSIVIADRSLADRRISGIFNTDDIDGAVEAIARELGAGARLLPLLAVLY